MSKKASPPKPELDIIEEAMARARLKHMRAKPAFQPTRQALGLSVRKVTRKHLKGQGSPLSKLRDDWTMIVGDKIATLCRPEKLTGAKTSRTLTLRVLPAAAALIQHQSETIRQRVSVAAGGGIAKLKIEQGELRRDLPKRKTKRALTPAEKEALQDSVAKIDDPALKAAIVALGSAVLTDET